MRDSKVFTLLKSLTESEVAALSDNIRQPKRASLKKLFLLLCRSLKTGEPDAREIYKSVFGEKYLKSKDYLLRNEYRLLYDWLLVQIQKNETDGKELNIETVLNYFLKKRSYDLFEEEFNTAWKQALAVDDVQLLCSLSNLNLQYFLDARTQNLENAEITAALSEQRIALLKTKLLREIRKEEVRLKVSERIISAYKEVTQPKSKTVNVDLNALEKDDLYAQYLAMRAEINFARGAKKIQLLKKILSEETIIRKYEPQPEEAISRFLINLGQEYYLSSDFKASTENYSKAYRHFDKISIPAKEILVINYVIALMRCNAHVAAEKFATEHAALMLQSKILAGRSPFLLAVLNLYSNKPDDAEKYVNLETKKDGTEFYYFMRLVLSAVYFLRGDMDLALREAINIDQAVNYEMNRNANLQTQISKPIVSAFRKFYQVVQNKSSSQKTELHKLQSEIIKSVKSNPDQSPNSVLTQWLLKKIEEMTSGKKLR